MKPDPVSALLAAAEHLRATARTIEALELSSADNRDDLRLLLAGIRREAFCALTIAAVELNPEALPRSAAAKRA